jgi:diguanylate cyclase (GGDEF)-like protein/PAS domain S-box-containing protein
MPMGTTRNGPVAADEALAALQREMAELNVRLAGLAEREEKYRLVAEHSGDCLWMMDLATLRFTYVSPSVMQLYGATAEETLRKALPDVLPPHSLELVAKVLEEELAVEAAGTADPKRTRTIEIEEYRKDGSLVWIENVLSFQRDERQQPVAIIGVSRDVTERRRLREELRALAITDPLTGAFNRRHFLEVLPWEIQRSDRYASPLSLIMLDIDHFKTINDGFGHQAGDRVLVELAEVIRRRIRSVDFLIRWGGEEFLIMLTNTDLGKAVLLAEDILQLLRSQRFSHAGSLTVSLGVTQYRDRESIDAFLARGDNLLYQAKREGRDRVVHDGTGPATLAAAGGDRGNAVV